MRQISDEQFEELERCILALGFSDEQEMQSHAKALRILTSLPTVQPEGDRERALEDLKPFLDLKSPPFSDGARVIWQHSKTIRASLQQPAVSGEVVQFIVDMRDYGKTLQETGRSGSEIRSGMALEERAAKILALLGKGE